MYSNGTDNNSVTGGNICMKFCNRTQYDVPETNLLSKLLPKNPSIQAIQSAANFTW